jgi:hypothetical protein
LAVGGAAVADVGLTTLSLVASAAGGVAKSVFIASESGTGAFHGMVDARIIGGGEAIEVDGGVGFAATVGAAAGGAICASAVAGALRAWFGATLGGVGAVAGRAKLGSVKAWPATGDSCVRDPPSTDIGCTPPAAASCVVSAGRNGAGSGLAWAGLGVTGAVAGAAAVEGLADGVAAWASTGAAIGFGASGAATGDADSCAAPGETLLLAAAGPTAGTLGAGAACARTGVAIGVREGGDGSAVGAGAGLG